MALSNIRWKGMKAFEEMTAILPDKIGGQKLKSAYRFALKPTLGKMRDALPANRTGKLWYATAINIGGGKELKNIFGLVGPRRKKNTWNMQGWHAHLIESGTKAHKIKSKSAMPVFAKGGFTGKFAKTINHPGSTAFKPFQKSIDSTWGTVSLRVSDKVSDIMRGEISNIWKEYGNVSTR